LSAFGAQPAVDFGVGWWHLLLTFIPACVAIGITASEWILLPPISGQVQAQTGLSASAPASVGLGLVVVLVASTAALLAGLRLAARPALKLPFGAGAEPVAIPAGRP
jgi:hypothetical protein